jgi:hypothetical protein
MAAVDEDDERLPLGPGVIAATEAAATGRALADLGLHVRLDLMADRIAIADDDGGAMDLPLDRIAGIRLGVIFPDDWRARVGGMMGARPVFLIQLRDGAGVIRVSGSHYNQDFRLFMRALAELVLRDRPAIVVETGGRLGSALLAAIVCVPLVAGAVALAVIAVINRDAITFAVAIAAILVLVFMIREALRRLPRRAKALSDVDRALAL